MVDDGEATTIRRGHLVNLLRAETGCGGRVGCHVLNLDELVPPRVPDRVAVHVSADALRQIRGGHPWVWNRSIERVSPAGQLGDLAVVFDDRRKFAAIGLWDPDAAIPVRILHQGAPTTIDDDFFTTRLFEAFDRRRVLQLDPATTAYRLVHGENDGLPGLVIDRYGDTLVAKLDTLAWLPHLGGVLQTAAETTDAERVVLRASRRIATGLPTHVRDRPTVIGSSPTESIRFLENGLEFEADVERGQKTGHFLDQRDNRQLAATRCSDAAVLDVFCNTGGFSVHAAAGGARSVHSIDMSAHAVDATRRHVEINRAARNFETNHSALVADAFEAMADLADRHQRFDVVVVDPPSFAPNAAALPAATRAYRRLTGLAVELLSPGGTLVQASCSSRLGSQEFYKLITEEIEHAGCRAINSVRTGHAIDHPIGFEHGAYLKALFAEIIPS